MNAVMNIVLC